MDERDQDAVDWYGKGHKGRRKMRRRPIELRALTIVLIVAFLLILTCVCCSAGVLGQY
jgi:hypothetical protein